METRVKPATQSFLRKYCSRKDHNPTKVVNVLEKWPYESIRSNDVAENFTSCTFGMKS